MYGQEMYHSVQKIFIVTTNRNRNRKNLFKICVWCFKSETKGQNFVRLHIWLYYLFAYLKQNQSLRQSVKFKDCTYTLNKDLHLALSLSGLNCWPIPRALPLSYDIHSQGTNKQTNSNTNKNSENLFFFQSKRKLEFGNKLLDYQLVNIYFDVDGMFGYINTSNRTY